MRDTREKVRPRNIASKPKLPLQGVLNLSECVCVCVCDCLCVCLFACVLACLLGYLLVYLVVCLFVCFCLFASLSIFDFTTLFRGPFEGEVSTPAHFPGKTSKRTAREPFRALGDLRGYTEHLDEMPAGRAKPRCQRVEARDKRYHPQTCGFPLCSFYIPQKQEVPPQKNCGLFLVLLLDSC